MTLDEEIGRREGWIREMDDRDRVSLKEDIDSIVQNVDRFVRGDKTEDLQNAVYRLLGQIEPIYLGVPSGDPTDEARRIGEKIQSLRVAAKRIFLKKDPASLQEAAGDSEALKLIADDIKMTYDDFTSRRERYRTELSDLRRSTR